MRSDESKSGGKPQMNDLLNDVIQRAMNMAEQHKGEALLLFGESHDPIPRTLIRDPDLPANAKLIWCHLRSVTGDPTRPDMAPRYADLMRDLSIGSRQTVAHCYHALRLTRWITLVTRRVDRFGYTVGNVYGLHTTPATIQQTLELDASYPGFLQHLCGLADPRHAGLRSLARRILDHAIDQIGKPDEALDPFIQQMNAHCGNISAFFRAAAAPGDSRPRSPELLDIPAPSPVLSDLDSPLDFHNDILKLSAQSKRLVGIQMGRLPEDMRQLFLNELAGIVRERQSGDRPIRNPVAYLNRMVQQFGEGTLTLSTRCEQVESPKELASRNRKQEEERTRRETMAEISHLENMIRRNPCPQLQAQADKLRSGLNLSRN